MAEVLVNLLISDINIVSGSLHDRLLEGRIMGDGLPHVFIQTN